MSMEDIFYGPSERTWIVPTPEYYAEDRAPPPRRYIEREVIKEREVVEAATPRHRRPIVDEPLRPVERRAIVDQPLRPVERRAIVDEPLRSVERRAIVDEPLRPVERRVIERGHSIRPVERLDRRVHTPAVEIRRAEPHEEIRKVVEVPVPVPAIREVVKVPVPGPVKVVEVPVPVEVHHHHEVAPAPVVVKRSITPPIQRPIVHHPIELKVPMCCEKCAKKVKDRLLDVEGVENVVTDQYNQKVTVYGPADPARILNRVKLVKKRSAFWDLTVDYSENYRRYRAALQAEAARADAARAESAKAARAARAPAVTVVQLPQERHGPAVTAILPPERNHAMPYVANSRAHNVTYVSPLTAYRQERFYNGRS